MNQLRELINKGHRYKSYLFTNLDDSNISNVSISEDMALAVCTCFNVLLDVDYDTDTCIVSTKPDWAKEEIRHAQNCKNDSQSA